MQLRLFRSHWSNEMVKRLLNEYDGSTHFDVEKMGRHLAEAVEHFWAPGMSTSTYEDLQEDPANRELQRNAAQWLRVRLKDDRLNS